MLEQFEGASSGAAAPPTRRAASGGRRTLRRILAVLLSLAFLAAAAVGGYVMFLNSKISDIKTAPLLPSEEANEETPDSSSADDPPATDGGGDNYLIIGSDARPGETFSRSDVIILAHVNAAKTQVHLIHFPRDLYVAIPGHGKNKINAAYAFGGAPLLVRTMQNLLSTKIDHVAQIDFEGFQRMTDAVGGVRVWAEEASGSPDNPRFVITKGWNNLDGEQALAFVRERYELSEGDISRGRRQLAFVQALMIKALSPGVLLNPVKFSQFVGSATDNLTVDKGITPGYIRSEALSLRGLRGGDIEFITAPFTGYGTAPDGGAIDIVDEVAMKRLGDALQFDELPAYDAG